MKQTVYGFSILAIFIVSGLVLGERAQANPDPDTRTFTRDTSNAAMGDAWRDPRGLIWGDVKTTDGSVHDMNYHDATNYCATIGARLPSREEFIQLREYMGAQSGTWKGYSPQVLPNLADYWFWSSSESSEYPDVANYVFNGYLGIIDIAYRDEGWNVKTRCVAGR